MIRLAEPRGSEGLTTWGHYSVPGLWARDEIPGLTDLALVIREAASVCLQKPRL
jgi:hypothetical protein